ncbi:MAG: YncE family protein [Verrucomicrobiota bacterium]|nr:YncE family protein [Verrucomicrobiota bacterium]
MTSLLKNLCLVSALLGTGIAAHADYRVLTQFKIGGEGGYDYIRVDSAAHRLYVSHGTRVEVLDADTGKKLGEIAPTNGVHGIAIAPEFNHGFVSNGRDNTVTMFDLKTLRRLKVIPTGGKSPDALGYDHDTKQLFVCNHHSGSLSVIDADTAAVKGTIDVGGALEELVFDDRGHLFVNAEDRSIIHVIDTHALKLMGTWSVAPGEGPTGLAIDRAHHRLFSACGNQKFIVLDSDTGHVLTTLPIGEDPDGATFDPATGRAFASCRDGTLAVVQEKSPDEFKVLQNVSTQYGARTLTLDEKTGRIFLPTAEFGPVPANGSSHHRPILPGTFKVLVVGQS